MKFPQKAIWKNRDFDIEVTVVGIYGEMNGIFYYKLESGTGVPSNELFFYSLYIKILQKMNLIK